MNTGVASDIVGALGALAEAKRRTWQAFNDTSPIGFFRAARDVMRARAAASVQLARLPAEAFALAGVTPREGWLMTLTGSSKQPGGWQLTRFDREGLPYTDSQYPREDLVRAIDDLLKDCVLREVFGVDLGIYPADASPGAPVPV